MELSSAGFWRASKGETGGQETIVCSTAVCVCAGGLVWKALTSNTHTGRLEQQEHKRGNEAKLIPNHDIPTFSNDNRKSP